MSRYRVGSHYGIHVYEGDRPVASFFNADEAERFVEVMNAAEPEWQRYVDNLPWVVWPWQKRCKARAIIGNERWHEAFRNVRCELTREHDGFDHAVERGMEWWRWDDDDLWITSPGSPNQGRD